MFFLPSQRSHVIADLTDSSLVCAFRQTHETESERASCSPCFPSVQGKLKANSSAQAFHFLSPRLLHCVVLKLLVFLVEPGFTPTHPRPPPPSARLLMRLSTTNYGFLSIHLDSACPSSAKVRSMLCTCMQLLVRARPQISMTVISVM